MVTETSPGSTMPVPTPLAAWSPPPPTTGSPTGRPVASATSAVTRPVISGDSTQGGIHSRGMFSSASTSSLQRRSPTSSSTVPEASDTSVAYSPVMR